MEITTRQAPNSGRSVRIYHSHELEDVPQAASLTFDNEQFSICGDIPSLAHRYMAITFAQRHLDEVCNELARTLSHGTRTEFSLSERAGGVERPHLLSARPDRICLVLLDAPKHESKAAVLSLNKAAAIVDDLMRVQAGMAFADLPSDIHKVVPVNPLTLLEDRNTSLRRILHAPRHNCPFLSSSPDGVAWRRNISLAMP